MRKYLLFILLILLFSLNACQEEDNCVGCNLNPKIKLRFEALNTKKITEENLIEVKSKMKGLSDSLAIELLTDDQRTELLSALAILRVDSMKYADFFDLLRLGKTKIDFLDAAGAINFDQFQDTLVRDFSIPVDMNHDTSTFYFQYFGLSDTLQVHYQREINQTLDGMRMKIMEIGVNEEISTFDSIQVKCYKSDCSNDLTTIYVYF